MSVVQVFGMGDLSFKLQSMGEGAGGVPRSSRRGFDGLTRGAKIHHEGEGGDHTQRRPTMTVSGFDPFQTMDRLLGRSGFGEGGSRSLGLPVDVYRKGDEFIVEVDVPGMDPSVLDVSVERNMLSITGERPARHGDAEVVLCEGPHARFSRQLYLGENLDTEGVNAGYENGVLTITIPVSQKARPRKIEISGGGGAAIDVGSNS
jgi:HSP20 family protein